MDEELALLQQQLAEVQETDSVQRLSERNVVQLVFKLVEQKSLDLIYTFTGKEYLTRARAAQEILEEINSNHGRVRLDEVSASLKIDRSVVLQLTKELVQTSPELTLLSSAEVITEGYLDMAARVWKETLQETGQLTLGDIATQSSLPINVINEAVKKRLMTLIQAEFKNGVLYTRDYINTQRSVLRGALTAVTQPTLLTMIASEHNIELSTVEQCLKEFITEGLLKGKLSSGEYVPDKFLEMQRKSVDAFFNDNGLIEIKFLKKLKVKNPYKYICESHKDAIKLDSSIVSSSILSRLEASVEECALNSSVLDARTILPSLLTDKDCSTLISKLPSIKSRKNSTVTILKDFYIVANDLLGKISKGLKETVDNAASQAAKEKPTEGKMNFSEMSTSKTRRISGKKKKGRRRKGDHSEDEEEIKGSNKSSESKHLDFALAQFLQNEDQINPCVAQFLPECEELTNDVIEVFRSQIKAWFIKSFTQALSSIHHGDAAKTRKIQQQTERNLEETYPIFQAYIKGIQRLQESITHDEHTSKDLLLMKSLLVEGFCRKYVGQIVKYLCATNNIEFDPKMENERASVLEPASNVEHCRSKIAELPEILRKPLNKMYRYLENPDLQLELFRDLFEQMAVEECSLLVPKFDKKIERAVLFSRRQSLLSELRLEKDKDGVLTRVIALIIQQCDSIMLPIPEDKNDANMRNALHSLLPYVNSVMGSERAEILEEFISSPDNEKYLQQVKDLASLKDPKTYQP